MCGCGTPQSNFSQNENVKSSATLCFKKSPSLKTIPMRISTIYAIKNSENKKFQKSLSYCDTLKADIEHLGIDLI